MRLWWSWHHCLQLLSLWLPYLVWKEDPRGEVLDSDPGLDHHLLVGEGRVARSRQLRVALPLPLRPGEEEAAGQLTVQSWRVTN